MAGEAVAEREDHAVAALGHRLLERQHGERFGAVARGKLGELGTLGKLHGDLVAQALGVLGARRHDHQRLGRPVHRVLGDERDDAFDLGLGALDRTRDRVGGAGAVLDVVDAETAAAKIRAGPRERDDFATVEGVVHELGEVFATGAVAPGQGHHGQQLSEALEHRDVVECHGGRLGVAGFGGRHRGLGRSRRNRRC